LPLTRLLLLLLLFLSLPYYINSDVNSEVNAFTFVHAGILLQGIFTQLSGTTFAITSPPVFGIVWSLICKTPVC
jgi:hypothetical protein